MTITSNIKDRYDELSLTVEERVNFIVKTIKEEEQRLREKHPFLRYQNLIGFMIMLLSLAGMIGSGFLYYYDIIPAWLAIVASAIFASFSHELEHDLIHRQYFRKNKFMHNTMMLVVWAMRPNTVNPWYRRDIHFLHHKTSGTEQDLEERLVGNGLRGVIRWIVMLDGMIGLLLRRKILSSEVDRFSFWEVIRAGFPLVFLYFAAWHAFLLFHLFNFFFGGVVVYPSIVLDCVDLLNFLVVVLIAPNFIRSGCLNIVTSYMHYYGNVQNLLQQTQVFKPWFMWPLQVFCFNFGSTHSIHHFVVGQPFYIRQMVAKAAHKVMKEQGVRFNDMTTFVTANRYLPNPTP